MTTRQLASDAREYQLSYTGNDGLHREQDWTGTPPELVRQVTLLEEHGCHGIFVYDDSDSEVYALGSWQ